MNLQKRGGSWVANVCVNTVRKSKSFKKKREAIAWGNLQEQDGILARHTLHETLAAYIPVAEKKRGYKAELSRLKSLHALPDLPLDLLNKKVLTEWRDHRLTQVAPVSVRRELILLSAVFKAAIEWGWIRENPAKLVKWPETSNPRRRGITSDEIAEIYKRLEPTRTGLQVRAMFDLSLETGMRLGELLSLTWGEVKDKSVSLPKTKNGDQREVPLSPRAREIIESRRNIDPETVFTLSAHVVSKAFSRASVNGVHFHDARGEAITRLSKKLDVLQLAKMIGHRDLKSLMHYYSESADSIADRL